MCSAHPSRYVGATGALAKVRAGVRAGGRAHSCQQHLPRPLFHSRTYHGTAEDVELAEIPVMPQIGSAAPITPFVPYGRTLKGSPNACVLPQHVPELPCMPAVIPQHATFIPYACPRATECVVGVRAHMQVRGESGAAAHGRRASRNLCRHSYRSGCAAVCLPEGPSRAAMCAVRPTSVKVSTSTPQ